MSAVLSAISPLDGRYGEKVQELKQFFSEAALMEYRVYIECEWLIFLGNSLHLPGTRALNAKEIQKIRLLYESFDEDEAMAIKQIEKKTNHDVKAVEYYIRDRFGNSSFKELLEFVHFGCTSEDINNLAYALILRDGIEEVLMPMVLDLSMNFKKKSKEYKDISLLARTHGQPATPTTLGKEFLVFAARLNRQIDSFNNISFWGKMNGASGNFNAHMISYPEIDWIKASEEFVSSLGLEPNLYTTQIEPHDFVAEICDCFRRINTILIDFSRDMWSYISFEVFHQKAVSSEVGSSTMPHKVNPIDFENAEGNFGIANALFGHFSEKLPISRLQRDLTDSTVFRNLGVAFGHCLLAYKSLIKGLEKLEVNKKKIGAQLENNWGVLAEAIQMVMRRHKVSGAYEKLKELTRGKEIGKKEIQSFIKSLKIPEKEKKRLLSLTPQKYTGLAEELVAKFLN